MLAEEPAFRTFVSEVSAFAIDALQARPLVPLDPRTRRQATILRTDFRHAEQGSSGVAPEVALERLDHFSTRQPHSWVKTGKSADGFRETSWSHPSARLSRWKDMPRLPAGPRSP